MDQAIGDFLKESIGMELNVGEVYQLFSVKFPQDHDFWWRISMEEMHHAALIESINDLFLSDNTFEKDPIEKQTQDLKTLNQLVKQRIAQYKLVSPTRLEAFQYGFEMENSVAEFHFELFMTTAPESPVMKIFQKLNGDDLNHAIRIKNYMIENGII